MKIKFILLIILTNGIFLTIFAQQDTVINDTILKKLPEINIQDADTVKQYSAIKNPVKATLYSALIPGLGQIYNEKYWKVPIVYTCLGGVVFFSDYNNKQYKRYLAAYIAETDDLEETVSEFDGQRTKEDLLYLKKKFRRNRDISYLLIFGIYFLNVIDATVDAHLYDFDISDDLSLRILPDIIQGIDYQNTIGLRLSINF